MTFYSSYPELYLAIHSVPHPGQFIFELYTTVFLGIPLYLSLPSLTVNFSDIKGTYPIIGSDLLIGIVYTKFHSPSQNDCIIFNSIKLNEFHTIERIGVTKKS